MNYSKRHTYGINGTKLQLMKVKKRATAVRILSMYTSVPGTVPVVVALVVRAMLHSWEVLGLILGPEAALNLRRLT